MTSGILAIELLIKIYKADEGINIDEFSGEERTIINDALIRRKFVKIEDNHYCTTYAGRNWCETWNFVEEG